VGFSRYAKQGPQQGRTVPYPLRGLRNPDGTSPILHVEHIGEGNRAFWLDSLARASAKAGKPSGTTPVEIDRARREARDDNREILISFSVRRVENAFHDDGTPATNADIRAIVMAIPDEDFDRLTVFVNSYNNFRDYTITEEPDKLAEK
jgi:hypothetical protein